MWCGKSLMEEYEFPFSTTIRKPVVWTYFQPCCQALLSLSLRHSMASVLFVITASITQLNTSWPSSSKMTSVIMKCFSLFLGFAAVHLLWSNFFGLICVTVLYLSAIKEQKFRHWNQMALVLNPDSINRSWCAFIVSGTSTFSIACRFCAISNAE